MIRQWQLTAKDNWSYSFELPRLNADGSEIKYTIDEKEVDGYTKRIDGYDLINTYTGSTDAPSGPSGPSDAPLTGDTVNLLILFILMLVSGAVLLLALLHIRGNKGKHCK